VTDRPVKGILGDGQTISFDINIDRHQGSVNNMDNQLKEVQAPTVKMLINGNKNLSGSSTRFPHPPGSPQMHVTASTIIFSLEVN
jgi:hypothetical protein